MAIKWGANAKIDLLTIDGSGGGTGMSPWRMMQEWGLPSIYLHAAARDFCQVLADKGQRPPDIAFAGGFSSEDGVFKAIALGAPFVKAVCMGRALMIPGMVGKNIELWLKEGKLPHLERHGRGRIVIGKDTRLSGYMLETAIASGICSMGLDVWLVGPLPTPGIAFITRSMRADAGVVISASHNPFQDNGIKLFSGEGFKLPDELEYEIERFITDGSLEELRPVASEIGKAHRIDDAVGRYVVFLKNSFPQEYSLNGLKIVADCANGATYKVAPAVFEELGAHVVPFAVEPNGENINRDCGTLFPEALQELVVEHNAHVGVAFDGDGDRALFVDEKGELVDGDAVLVICGKYLKSKNALKGNTVVATIQSNMGVEEGLKGVGHCGGADRRRRPLCP